MKAKVETSQIEINRLAIDGKNLKKTHLEQITLLTTGQAMEGLLAGHLVVVSKFSFSLLEKKLNERYSGHESYNKPYYKLNNTRSPLNTFGILLYHEGENRLFLCHHGIIDTIEDNHHEYESSYIGIIDMIEELKLNTLDVGYNETFRAITPIVSKNRSKLRDTHTALTSCAESFSEFVFFDYGNFLRSACLITEMDKQAERPLGKVVAELLMLTCPNHSADGLTLKDFEDLWDEFDGTVEAFTLKYMKSAVANYHIKQDGALSNYLINTLSLDIQNTLKKLALDVEDDVIDAIESRGRLIKIIEIAPYSMLI